MTIARKTISSRRRRSAYYLNGKHENNVTATSLHKCMAILQNYTWRQISRPFRCKVAILGTASKTKHCKYWYWPKGGDAVLLGR